jgi:hypothetical protein
MGGVRKVATATDAFQVVCDKRFGVNAFLEGRDFLVAREEPPITLREVDYVTGWR